MDRWAGAKFVRCPEQGRFSSMVLRRPLLSYPKRFWALTQAVRKHFSTHWIALCPGTMKRKQLSIWPFGISTANKLVWPFTHCWVAARRLAYPSARKSGQWRPTKWLRWPSCHCRAGCVFSVLRLGMIRIGAGMQTGWSLCAKLSAVRQQSLATGLDVGTGCQRSGRREKLPGWILSLNSPVQPSRNVQRSAWPLGR